MAGASGVLSGRARALGIAEHNGLCLFLHQQHNVADLQEFNSSGNLTVTKSRWLVQWPTPSY